MIRLFGFWNGNWEPVKDSVVNDIVNTGTWIIYTNAEGRAKKQPKLITKNNSVESRTETYLKLFNQDYKEWSIVWVNRWVKTEVLVCIARADTHLGYAMKSENNFWNVGNNDRWDTVSYNSRLSGIMAIWAALSNKYLWKKETIGDLSYAWGCKIDCWKVYASSNDNRQNNVLNCLSNIHMKKITQDFTFRK
jgi:hypothetical protein